MWKHQTIGIRQKRGPSPPIALGKGALWLTFQASQIPLPHDFGNNNGGQGGVSVHGHVHRYNGHNDHCMSMRIRRGSPAPIP